MSELSVTTYLWIFVGGFMAGVINTFGGNGSIITLSLLTDSIGLPANVANGTNRVGIFCGAVANGYGFAKNNMLEIAKFRHIILVTCLGAIIGVMLAIRVSNYQFLFVYKYTLVFILFIIIFDPSKWIQNSQALQLPKVVTIPIYLLLGVYGGFIQMGVGIMFVAVLVLISRYNIMDANAIKTPIVAIYTGLVIFIFAYQGLVNWQAGLLVAVGQTVGSYLAALYAPQYPQSSLWAFRLLLLVIIYSIFKQFNILN